MARVDGGLFVYLFFSHPSSFTCVARKRCAVVADLGRGALCALPGRRCRVAGLSLSNFRVRRCMRRHASRGILARGLPPSRCVCRERTVMCERFAKHLRLLKSATFFWRKGGATEVREDAGGDGICILVRLGLCPSLEREPIRCRIPVWSRSYSYSGAAWGPLILPVFVSRGTSCRLCVVWSCLREGRACHLELLVRFLFIVCKLCEQYIIEERTFLFTFLW